VEQLPVVLGARLSLSFPLLLSAIPLYTVSAESAHNYQPGTTLDATRDLQKSWFSDGGICSNFPIHFFDTWLPHHPTFGINLTSVKKPVGMSLSTSALTEPHLEKMSAASLAQSKGQDVYLPQPEERLEPEWQDIKGPIAFLKAIFGSAQNYRDTMQANLPSYRERIVQIRLDADEGGLNLTMPPEIIQKIVDKGAEGACLLTDPAGFNFEHHWWVRFLVLMAQLEENIDHLQGMFDATGQPNFKARLAQVVASGIPGHDPKLKYPYYRDQIWCDEAIPRIDALQKLINGWGKMVFFRQNVPQPDPVLRVTPEF